MGSLDGCTLYEDDFFRKYFSIIQEVSISMQNTFTKCPKIHQHGWGWVFQAPSPLLALNAYRNDTKWPCVSNSLCWGSPKRWLLVNRCSNWSARTRANRRLPPSSWVISGDQPSKDDLTLIPNQPQLAYEAYDYMLTDVCGEGVDWASRISSPIRRACELISQSPVHSGLRNLQIVLLLCGSIHLVRGSR